MSFQIESGICSGRSFNASGFMGKFKTWVVKSLASGGPGWFIVDDQSGLGTDPYLLISDVASPTVNGYSNGQSGNAQKILRVGFITANSGQIDVRRYMGLSGGVPYGQWGNATNSSTITVLDSTDFAYDFRGGDDSMMLFARIGTSTDYIIETEWIGASNTVFETKNITSVTTIMTGGTDTESIEVTSSALFTVGDILIIYDFTAHNWVQQVEVTVIPDSTHITIENSGGNNLNAYPVGTVIGNYMHRNLSIGKLGSQSSQLPYLPNNVGSVDSDLYSSTSVLQQSKLGTPTNFLVNDLSYGGRTCIQPIIYNDRLYITSSESPEVFGTPKNIYISSTSSFLPWYSGLTISGDNWVYIGDGTLVPNSSSL